MREYRYLLYIGIVIGLFLRLLGLGYGLPYLYHPDETRQILDTLSMAQRGSIVPIDLTYPALHKYLLLFIFWAYYIFGKFINIFHSPHEFALSFLQNPFYLFLLGRAASVLFGLGIGIMIYKLCKTIFGEVSALIAALFSIFVYQLIGHSQFAIADIMLTFFTTAAFCFIFLDMRFYRNKYFYSSCVLIGLCISTKFQGIFILVPLLVSQIYLIINKKDKMTWLLRRYALGSILLLLSSSLGNIAFFCNPSAYIEKFDVISGVSRVGLSSAPVYSGGLLGLFLWFGGQIVKQEMLIGVFILLGIAAAMLRHDRYDIVCLSYLLLYFIALKDFGFRYLHLLTVTFGVMCLLAGRLFSFLLEKAKNKLLKNVFYFLILISLGLSVWRGFSAGMLKRQEDTRIEAKSWIEENIPSNTKIGIDWYAFCPPLFGNIPVIINNTMTAEDYYRYNMPDVIKQEFNSFLSKNPELKMYELIHLMYSTPEPLWPEEMPESAREKAEGNEMLRELYSWFNFMRLDEIRERNVQYVVISSYSYSHFLLDNDKRKTGIFNPYIFEDMIHCNRQAEVYDGATLNGLLFFLTKRARDFYLEFLDETGNARLIKEFIPGAKRPGPVIRIYKLESNYGI